MCDLEAGLRTKIFTYQSPEMNDFNIYGTFLSHSHLDAELVGYIASKLEDEHNLKVWLGKWTIVPGKPFIQALFPF